MRKKDLELFLSRLQSFVSANVKLEQYSTPSSIAADVLWDAYQKGHIEGKVVADLGSGPGIFGIGALFLGAKKVYFVDIDSEALNIAKKNKLILDEVFHKKYPASFSCSSVKQFRRKVDVVFENPPFGVQNEHADLAFLETAIEISPLVYSFHKLSTEKFIESFIQKKGFHVLFLYRYAFPLKKQFFFHTSRIKKIEVGCWCFEKY